MQPFAATEHFAQNGAWRAWINFRCIIDHRVSQYSSRTAGILLGPSSRHSRSASCGRVRRQRQRSAVNQTCQYYSCLCTSIQYRYQRTPTATVKLHGTGQTHSTQPELFALLVAACTPAKCLCFASAVFSRGTFRACLACCSLSKHVSPAVMTLADTTRARTCDLLQHLSVPLD